MKTKFVYPWCLNMVVRKAPQCCDCHQETSHFKTETLEFFIFDSNMHLHRLANQKHMYKAAFSHIQSAEMCAARKGYLTALVQEVKLKNEISGSCMQAEQPP